MPVLFTIITKNAMAISITTHTTQEDLTGKSHWWGAPDLPDNVPYPCITCEDEEGTYEEPLTFVCQIRCADIASLDPENLLPHTGMLYFFAPIAYFLGETDSPLDYHDAPAVLTKHPDIDEVIKRELEVFLDARCETGAKAKCKCRELYDAFVDWCLARDVQPPSINRMSAVLRQIRPFTTYRSDCDYKWRGVMLKQ